MSRSELSSSLSNCYSYNQTIYEINSWIWIHSFHNYICCSSAEKFFSFITNTCRLFICSWLAIFSQLLGKLIITKPRRNNIAVILITILTHSTGAYFLNIITRIIQQEISLNTYCLYLERLKVRHRIHSKNKYCCSFTHYFAEFWIKRSEYCNLLIPRTVIKKKNRSTRVYFSPILYAVPVCNALFEEYIILFSVKLSNPYPV